MSRLGLRSVCMAFSRDCVGCESASNLDPTPIEHHIVEAEPELFISGVLDRRPTGTLVLPHLRMLP